MTDLRDARLQRALAAADEELHGPSELARRAILRAAHEAVQVPVPWWRRLWEAPAVGVPLRAVLASLLLAGFVTLLWHDKEIPGARPQGSAADVEAPAAKATAPASMPAPAAAPTPASPVPEPAAAPAPAQAPKVAGEAADALKRSPSLSSVPAPVAPQAVAPEPPVRRQEQVRDGAPAAEDRAAQAQSESAQRGAPAAAAAAPAPPAPIGSAAPAAAPSPPPPAARMRARAAWEDWTEARVESQGRGAAVAREQAFHLAELLYRVIGAPADAQPFAAPADVRLSLTQRGIAVGVLELGAEQARWTAAGESPRVLRPDPQALAALKAEAQRLAGR